MPATWEDGVLLTNEVTTSTNRTTRSTGSQQHHRLSPTVPEQIPKRALVTLHHVNRIMQVPLLDAVASLHNCCGSDVHDFCAKRLHGIACNGPVVAYACPQSRDDLHVHGSCVVSSMVES